WSLGLNFFYYGNNYLIIVLPTLIIAPRVLSGELEVGRIVQATGAFSAILDALTLLVDNLESLSRFAASVGRLETFDQSLSPDGAHAPAKRETSRSVIQNNGKPSAKPESEKIHTEEAERLAFENFTLKT